MVQAIHAAHDAGRFFCSPDDDVPSVVLCSCPDEVELLQTAAKLEARGIRFTLFREPDIDNQATALATEPLSGNVRKFFSKWKLWKGGEICRRYTDVVPREPESRRSGVSEVNLVKEVCHD